MADALKPDTATGSNIGGIAGDRLRAFIERIEHLEEEKRTLAADIKEVYAEAKGNGFDTKIMRKLVALRRMDQDDLDEQETMLEIYKRALGMLIDTPLGQAALAKLDETVATAASHPKRVGRPPGTGKKAKEDAEAAIHEEARRVGYENGVAGHMDNAARWPAGTVGHGNYELGRADGEREREAAAASTSEPAPSAGEVLH